MPGHELSALQRELRPLRDPQEMALVLARAIRSVADRIETAGKDLLAVCLPRVAVERSGNDVMLVYGPLSQTSLGSAYLPTDSSEVIQHAPNFACPGVGFIKASGGPLES